MSPPSMHELCYGAIPGYHQGHGHTSTEFWEACEQAVAMLCPGPMCELENVIAEAGSFLTC